MNLPSAMKKYMYSNLNQYKDNGLQCTKMYSVVQHPDNSLVLGVDVEKAPPPAPPEPPEPPAPPAPPASPAPTWFLVCMRIMFIFQVILIITHSVFGQVHDHSFIVIPRLCHMVLSSAVWLIHEMSSNISDDVKMIVTFLVAIYQFMMIVAILALLYDFYLLLVIFIYYMIFALLYASRR